MPRTAFAILGLLTACNDRAKYTLDITPLYPLNQTPMTAGPTATLTVREDGDVEVLFLGFPTATATAEELGPLDDAWIGLALERTGGSEGTIDPSKLIAFGETGPFTVETEQEPLTASMLVAETGGIGEIGASPSAPDGTLVMLANGDTLLFGADGYDNVQRMPNLDEGSWEFADYTLLPDYDNDGTVDPQSRATATLVQNGDSEWIILAGGENGTTNVAILDATAGAFTWASAGLQFPRTDHRAVPLTDGKVLLVGGRDDSGDFAETTYEIFDPVGQETFASGTLTGLPGLGFAAVPLNSNEALLCGGAAPNDTVTYTDPVEGCLKMLSNGTTEEVESLPVALQGLAMIALDDGRVLAVGGSSLRAHANSGGEATGRAFVFDPAIDTWTEVGAMTHARAHAALVPTPDGKVLVVGGTSRANALDSVLGDAVSCNELFNPGSFTFEALEPCGLPGSGANPLVAAQPDHGAVVIDGADADGDGGTNFGIIGFGPNF